MTAGSRSVCGERRFCLLCLIGLRLPRVLAEPLTRWLRYRKPAWVSARQQLYPRFFGRS